MAKRDLDKPEMKPVVTGKVSKKSKGVLGGFLTKNDIQAVVSTIVKDNVVPEIKKGAFNGIMMLVEWALFGEATGKFMKPSGSRIAYNTFSNRQSSITSKKGYPGSRYDVDIIEFDSRIDADTVLDALSEYVSTYGYFSIADYYMACKQPYEYTDNNYGWFDMRGIRIVRSSNMKWIIDFPKAQPLDD